MKLKISDIIIGKRIRQDPGNIEEMAQSIIMFGTDAIPPILVRKLDNGKWKLLAGWRRIQAHLLADKTIIDAKQVSK